MKRTRASGGARMAKTASAYRALVNPEENTAPYVAHISDISNRVDASQSSKPDPYNSPRLEIFPVLPCIFVEPESGPAPTSRNGVRSALKSRPNSVLIFTGDFMQRADRVESIGPLTSLRFVAAMMIVLHHAKNYFAWPWLAPLPGTLVHGVSFFFVLSGFILTHVYTSKPFPGYRTFLRARFARLWPVHIFALLALVTLVRPDSITFDGPGIFNKWVQLAFNVTLTHAIMPFTSYAFSWNAVSWSISTEMCFYVAFPLLLINLKRTWHWKLLGAALTLAMVLVVLRIMQLPADAGVNDISLISALYTNPLVRGFEFCLGMASWVLWDRYVKPIRLGSFEWTVIEIALLALLFAWLKWGFYRVVGYIPFVSARIAFGQAGSCWLYAIFIAVMASSRGLLGKALNLPVCIVLGEISFSVYMLHQLLMKFFYGWLPTGATSPVMFFATLLFVSAGSFVLVEKPAQRFLTKRNQKRAPIMAPAR